MSSIGGVSFYQQDQNYWQQAQNQSAASSADDSLINVMGTAMVDQAKGLASIANGIALKRVNSQLSAAVQAALEPSGSSSSSSGSSSSSSNSGSSASTTASSSSGAPATGVGTAPVSTSTTLSSLGILPKGTISVSAGTNTTTYTSTGTDTIGDLIDAINIDLPTNANVTATLNSRGQLVITSRDDADLISVGGIYASNIGFAPGHNSFEPTKPTSSPLSSSSESTGAASSGTSSSTKSPASTSSKSTSSKSTTTVSTPAQQSFATAASLLSASGVGGTLVDMLA